MIFNPISFLYRRSRRIFHWNKWNDLQSPARLPWNWSSNWKGCGYTWKVIFGYTNTAKNFNLFTSWYLVWSIFMSEMAYGFVQYWLCHLAHHTIVLCAICKRCRLFIVRSYSGKLLYSIANVFCTSFAIRLEIFAKRFTAPPPLRGRL